MPRLSDLLSENTDKQKLNRIRGQGRKRRGGRSAPGRKPHTAGRDTGLKIPSFVALDLETTGLDSKRDRITEIGAMKYIDGRPGDTFTTLVNPGMPIPREVRELTGITDNDVKDAPDFVDVIDDVLAFVGNLPICGHQVRFDISFLGEESLRCGRRRPKNLTLDTAILSRLLLPGLDGYSLGRVASHLGVSLPQAHRAFDDARATGMVAASLLPRIMDIPVDVRRIMASFCPHSLLKRVLGESLSHRGAGHRAWVVKLPPVPKPLKPVPEPVKIAPERVLEMFAADGPLGASMPGFVPRESQTEMALAVADTLNGGSLLAAEAGTGTGKSLAYLVPASLWAHANSRRVLVATHTRNLQDQLAKKDLPVIGELLGESFHFSVLKGRSNYLCINRYRKLLAGEIGNLSLRDREGLLPLIGWAEQTTVGDVEEQQQFNRRWYAKVWNLISAEAHQCEGRRCPYHDKCFLQNARRRALASHVVVINHALFFSDVCSESSFLGPAGPMVFDEAHHLETSGFRSLCVTLDTRRVRDYTERCAALLRNLEKRAANDEAHAQARHLKKVVKRLRRDGGMMLAEVAGWARRQGTGSAEFEIAYQAKQMDVLPGVAALGIVLSDLQDLLADLHQALVDFGDGEEDADLAAEVQECMTHTSQLKADLSYLAAAITEDHVFWLEGNHRKEWVKLCGVPLDIGNLLASVWAKNEHGVVFTSATLSVAGSMSYFERRTGLTGVNAERSAAAIYESPFVPEQMIRGALRDVPAPDSKEFAAFCAAAIARVHRELGRNILVLFTSNAMLRAVDELLRTDTMVDTAKVLTQNVSGGRHQILERFTQSKGAILLGTASFWEGVDAPGEACEAVVIPRLPFPVPTHPLVQALAEKAAREHGESFVSYMIPEAVIRLRQGAGRLIRTPTDRGTLLVLDKRIVTRGYGKCFMRSLGGSFETFADMEAMLKAVNYFFQSPPAGGGELSYVPLDEA